MKRSEGWPSGSGDAEDAQGDAAGRAERCLHALQRVLRADHVAGELERVGLEPRERRTCRAGRARDDGAGRDDHRLEPLGRAIAEVRGLADRVADGVGAGRGLAVHYDDAIGRIDRQAGADRIDRDDDAPGLAGGADPGLHARERVAGPEERIDEKARVGREDVADRLIGRGDG